jgi:hypothetical protein
MGEEPESMEERVLLLEMAVGMLIGELGRRDPQTLSALTEDTRSRAEKSAQPESARALRLLAAALPGWGYGGSTEPRPAAAGVPPIDQPPG